MLKVKHFLQQCRSEQRELRILMEKREQLRSSLLPAAVQPKDVNVQTSGSGDKMSEVMAEAIDFDKKIESKLQEMINRQARAMDIISKVQKSQHRQVLILYYLGQNPRTLKERTWQEVADEMQYSVDYIYDLHGQALVEAEQYFK